MDASTLRPILAGGEGAARLESMISLIDRTIDTVRDLSSRLRPSVLDDLGVREAIEWLAADFSRRSGVECQLRLEAECGDLGEGISLALFRILQETLTNVARHAQARSVEITLSRESGAVVLEVEDDGVGIDPAILADGGSLGLLGMRERAAGLGGTFAVAPAGDSGTRVLVRVPR